MTALHTDPAHRAGSPEGDLSRPQTRRPRPGARVLKMDTHCHSRASSKPVIAAAGLIGCPESFSEPELVYDQAKARGMDLVTITDHDTIDGAMELVERKFQDFVVGEEVSVHFPEDRCLLHVLVWDLTPGLHDAIRASSLREDVYAFADWLKENNLPHSFAHPLYVQNGRLTRWHIERAALLFKSFETVNGAHDNTLNRTIDRYLNTLTPAKTQELIDRHGMTPVWPRVWEKSRTGGSDDHALLNVGRTWTGVEAAPGETLSAGEFVRRIGLGLATANGQGGHAALLAHQISTVGAHHFAKEHFKRRSPTGRYVSAKFLRFFGVEAEAPSKKRVLAYTAARKIWLGKKASKPSPVLKALQEEFKPLLEKYPNLKARMDPESWLDGTPASQHDEMAEFVGELIQTLGRAMETSASKAVDKKDASKILEHITGYLVLQAAQLPYIVSLFCQNKERRFVDQFQQETGSHDPSESARPLRVMKFTDTLADVNGVCRFIQNAVVTSTRLDIPVKDLPNIKNFDPVFATKMPKYDNLEIALPPILKMLRYADEVRPDVIHISTPGSVGCVGMLAAKLLRVPVVGVYHTDFPAYVDRLFDDRAATVTCQKFMSMFYKPFKAVFTRSADYAASLSALGMKDEAIVRLKAGYDDRHFSPAFRDTGVWTQHGIKPDSVKVLFCGRVSVEKNLPNLSSIWPNVRKQCALRGVEAELVIIGDGPYRQTMERELRAKGAHFLGFRHGEELSTLYASCDLFAFPSTTDTLGQVVMESQASGMPVLVTDIGGPQEVVQDGVTGHVLPAENLPRWTEAIVGLVCDHDQRRAMGEQAARFMKTMTFAASFEHYWQVHQDVRDRCGSGDTSDAEHAAAQPVHAAASA
jgi:glycosyltransferase involved in cell wall biosynthesis/predicted metal-dependent phosphoesterase TrpH